jgi:hypothetical protein
MPHEVLGKARGTGLFFLRDGLMQWRFIPELGKFRVHLGFSEVVPTSIYFPLPYTHGLSAVAIIIFSAPGRGANQIRIWCIQNRWRGGE